LAAKYLNIETVKYDEITGKGSKKISFADVDIKIAKDYSCEDADVTYKLTNHLNKILEKEKDLDSVYRKIELPLIQVLIDTERAGVLIDTEFLKKISSEFENNLSEIEKNIFKISDTNFNINSTKQLRALLFDKLNLPVLKKTPSGVPSTDEDVLNQLSLNYPIGKFLLEHRTLSKLKNTYIDKLPLMVNDTTNRVHTNYSQAVTSTGRLASNDPNLQNIPIKTKQGRLIRQAFIPEKGFSIISADYSQIELRIMAHLSEDKNLIKAFVDDKDVHTETASQIFNLESDSVNNEQRRFAKTINFGLIYGMSAFGLAKQLNIENNTAKNFIDKYFIKYPGIDNFMNQIKLKAKDDKYVTTISGRRLYLPNINHSKALVRKAAERTAINAPMQGSAADIIKIAMINVHDFLIKNKLKSRLIMQVHDELVIETENQELDLVKNEVKKIMESVLNLRIPLKVDIGTGKNWDEAH
jgi:DNA polymerase-1